MSIRKLFAFLLITSFFVIAVRNAHDPDLWWHLKTGEYILENGIPTQDPPFSFTVTDHEWITHEWLTEVFMILVYRAGGLYALSFVFAGLIALAFTLLYSSSPGRPYMAGFVCLWGISAALPFLNARPQMFNILLGAAFVFIVEAYKDGRVTSRWLWVLPLLSALWANLHSGFLLGIVILAVYVVGETAQLVYPGRDARGLARPQIKRLAAVTFATFLAAVLNPNTYRLWIYPFFTLGSNAMQATISEWQSPNFHEWVFWIFGIMLLGGLCILAFSEKRPTWSEFLFFLGAGAAGLQSVRHIPLFVIVATPIISRHLLSLLEGTRAYPLLSGEQPEAPLSPTLRYLNVFMAVLALIGGFVWALRELEDTDEIITAEFPVAAVDYLEREGLAQARIFNDYEWGGYLIWRGVPTFIDGRADLYGDDFIFYYMQTYRFQGDWQEPLDDYDVEYVLTQQNGGLAILLETSPEWEPIYRDELATIFTRTDAAAALE